MFFFWLIMSEAIKREAEMLRKARCDKGLTQQEVATKVGIPVKAYQRLEYGQRSISSASMKTGIAICHVLDIDPFSLILFEI